MSIAHWSPRAEWDAVPYSVRRGIEKILGATVVSAQNQTGGFSPGLAARVRCADGSRAFVKAVGPTLNPESPDLYRREAEVAAALPADAPAPTLHSVYDDGDWVALVFEELPGRPPGEPWRAEELHRVVDATNQLSALLTPCPSLAMPRIADELRTSFTAYSRFAANPPADLSGWELRHVAELAAMSEALFDHLDGDTLVHLDIRSDNVLLGDDGAVWFVDWPWASRGPAWVDVTLLLVDAARSGHDPEPLLAASPHATGVDPELITGFVAGIAGMMSEGSRRPAPPGLPGLRAFQRVYLKVALTWLRERTGWT